MFGSSQREATIDRLTELLQSQHESFLKDYAQRQQLYWMKYTILLDSDHFSFYIWDISKLLKDCIFKFIGSNGITTHPGRPMGDRRLISQMRLSIQRGVNS